MPETNEQKMTPLEVANHKMMLKGWRGACGFGSRNCKNPPVAHVGCVCTVPHLLMTTCEKHIASAVKAVFTGGCEVKVDRTMVGGDSSGLIEARRASSSALRAHEDFVDQLESNYASQRHPDRLSPQSEEMRSELLGQYTTSKQVVKDIERFRNSLGKRQNP